MRAHRAFVVSAAILVGSAALFAASAIPAARARPQTPSLGDCAFLAGAWKGAIGEGAPNPGQPGLGTQDRAEEHWSAPDGTSILGMFRWVNADGTPGVFEILAITQEEGGVFLRLRHMDARLQPWPTETVPMTLALAEASPGKAVFRAVESEKKLAAVTYHCPTPDELRILVEFAGEKPREPLDFRMKRAAAAAK